MGRRRCEGKSSKAGSLIKTAVSELNAIQEVHLRLKQQIALNKSLSREIVWHEAEEISLRRSKLRQARLLKQSRERQEQLRSLSRELLRKQEEERRRISCELHEAIAQTLTGINIRLANLKRQTGLNMRDFNRSVTSTQRLVGHAVNIVHQFSLELRPAVLDDLGLVPALTSAMKAFTTRTGVRTELKVFAGLEELEVIKRTALFRVAQEALSNVGRHAAATRVEVAIQKRSGCIHLRIFDDGRSFCVADRLSSPTAKRLGLLAMKERVEMVRGTFAIRSVLGEGTTIEAQIPLGTFKSRPAKPVQT